MSGRVHAEAKAAPKSSFTPVRTGLLQRKSLLGGAPGLIGEFANSRGKRLVSQPPLIQTKLTINQPNDRYEQEADRVADAVMRMPESGVQRQAEEEEEDLIQAKPLTEQITPLVQRQVEPEEEEEILQTKESSKQSPAVSSNLETNIQSLKTEGTHLPESIRAFFEPRFGHDFSKVKLHTNTRAAELARTEITPSMQRQENLGEEKDEELTQAKIAGDVTPEVTPAISSNIQSLQGGGRPLSWSERSFFEPRFGTDFSNVRVHNDTRAASVASSVNARAFTLGHNVVFGTGEYCPDASSGRKLLAHELTHVVQQSGGSTLISTDKNSENSIPNSQELSLVSPEFTGEQSRTFSVSARSAGPDVLQRTGDLAAVLRGLEAGDWDVDTLAAQLSDEQMATLSTSNRVRLIRYIANGYFVLNSDEQTILRLFRTIPAAHRTALVGALDAALLQRLESVLHHDEYQQYHVLLRGLFFGARSAEQAVREVESARTFPWADPGLIRAIWNVRFYYEVAEFTDQGRLRFVYWTNMAFMGVRNQAVEVDPMEMIIVHFHEDETEAGASRGQTIPMPAISLLSLVQKQFRGEMQTVADIALIGLGGAGLVGASTRLGRIIAALELAFGAADVVVRDFRARIARSEQGREFLEVWDIVSVLIAIYGFTRLAIEGVRIFLRLRRAWRAFRGSDDAVRMGDQLDPLRQQVDDVVDRADEARVAQQEGTPATPPALEGPAQTTGTTPPAQARETGRALPSVTQFNLQQIDPSTVQPIWRVTPPPSSGGQPVRVYRGFARNAGGHSRQVIREGEIGGVLSRDPDVAHDAVFNQVGRNPTLSGSDLGGIVEIHIPADLWDELVRTLNIAERGNYPGFSRTLNATEIRVNSLEAARLINNCTVYVRPPNWRP